MTLALKIGDTLSLAVLDTDNDLTSTTVTSAVKHGGFYEALTVSTPTESADGWEYILSASAGSTANWPLGSVDCDIKYTTDSGVVHTNTFQIMVNDRVTR